MRNQYKVLAEAYGLVKEEAAIADTPSVEVNPVQGQYLFLCDTNELMQLHPYKVVTPKGMIMKLASKWEKVIVMHGEDITRVLGKEVKDPAAWYIISGLKPDINTYTAYVGS